MTQDATTHVEQDTEVSGAPVSYNTIASTTVPISQDAMYYDDVVSISAEIKGSNGINAYARVYVEYRNKFGITIRTESAAINTTNTAYTSLSNTVAVGSYRYGQVEEAEVFLQFKTGSGGDTAYVRNAVAYLGSRRVL